jgi:threonine dehydrogenase-like Zn-dependent dehydrogenase
VRALVWRDVDRVEVADVPDPVLQGPGDAIVRITSAAICGTDLHFFHGKAPLSPGDILGHEGMGVVEQVGPGVRRFRPGDRVVLSFDVACGDCWYCRIGQTSLCEEFGNYGAGPFGGELAGTQAELVRVPTADVNLLPVPEGMADEQALFVGDILTTGYYGAAMAGIEPGATVAVIGVGPVGFFCVQSAFVLGAGRVIALDREEDRLALAAKFGAEPVTEGRGADVVIEAVGSLASFETSVEVVRRGGRIVVVGMFVGEQAEIPLGVWWTRMLDVRFAGICPIHAWWDRSMRAVEEGRIDPLPLISHVMPLEDAPEGYELFAARRAMKVVLKP